MLVRYDPLREFDRFADELFGGTGRVSHFMPLDVVRAEHHVELRLDLPGVAPDAIDVSVEGNVLTVSAERSWSPGEGETVVSRERPQGSVSRQIMLGESLDPEYLEASTEHGVLTIRIPVAEQAKPRKVEVRAASGAEAIEA